MKKSLMILALAATLPAFAAAESWSNVSMIDTQCSTKAKADPDDAHTRSCAMTCAKSGFGILDKQGNYLKFDDNGNREAVKLLEKSTAKDHIRVNVDRTRQGDTIRVQSMTM